jgi:TRAP-type C4-dicarboxylate transport system permease small subunit
MDYRGLFSWQEEKMSKFLDKVFMTIEYIMGIMIGLMIAFVFLNVILRTCFNSGLVWSEELSRYLFIFVTYIGAIGAMRDNTHLGMDTVVKHVPKVAMKPVYVLCQLMIIAIMGVLTQGSYKMSIQNIHAKAAATGIPLWIIYGIGVVTAVCISIICITNIFKALTVPNAVEKMILLHESEEDDIVEEATKNRPDRED